MDHLAGWIGPGHSMVELRAEAERTLRHLGVEAFWYWGVGAFVFSGRETVASVPGKAYRTPDAVVREDDIVTIDLSPRIGDVWGDFARTLVLENGTVLEDPARSGNPGWAGGIAAERELHAELLGLARPDMTFEELHAEMNRRIEAKGFENLDFLGNVGHSIERRSADRIYIERGNGAPLGSVECFTFEPHLRRPGGEYGFKHENIYFFVGDELREL